MSTTPNTRTCPLPDLDACIAFATRDQQSLTDISVQRLIEWRDRFNELYYYTESPAPIVQQFRDGMKGDHPALTKAPGRHEDVRYIVRSIDLKDLLRFVDLQAATLDAHRTYIEKLRSERDDRAVEKAAWESDKLRTYNRISQMEATIKRLESDLARTRARVPVFQEGKLLPVPNASSKSWIKWFRDGMAGKHPRYNVRADELDTLLRIAEMSLIDASSGMVAHSDDEAVDRFASRMKAKLAKKRAEGRSGWDDKAACSKEFLSGLLREHVIKGDPVDVGNLAMMLQQRGERIVPGQSPNGAAEREACAKLVEHWMPEPGPDGYSSIHVSTIRAMEAIAKLIRARGTAT